MLVIGQHFFVTVSKLLSSRSARPISTVVARVGSRSSGRYLSGRGWRFSSQNLFDLDLDPAPSFLTSVRSESFTLKKAQEASSETKVAKRDKLKLGPLSYEIMDENNSSINEEAREREHLECSSNIDSRASSVVAVEKDVDLSLCGGSGSKDSQSHVPVNDKESKKDQSSSGLQSLSKRAQKRIARCQRFKENQKKKKSERSRLNERNDAGYNLQDFTQSDYYFENGLRKVYPYSYVFATHAKGRWVGQKLYDVLAREFGYDHPNELSNAFESGRIQVNNHRVSNDYIVMDCDYISHRTHRHENPVTAAPIEVIVDNEDVVVVNKPSSIPCHPCGRYRFNSLVFIMGKEMGYTNLRNIYRLDRLTSGVLILGKTAQHTKILENQVLSRQVQKEYVCRVMGRFPDGEIEVDQPLKALSNKLRLQVVSPEGKPSQTRFKRISYNGTSSVVRCWPYTGRTHQIRVHLQFLGNPIINDVFYNSKAWGPNKGKDGLYEVPHEKVCETILAEHHANLWDGGENPLYAQKLKEEKLKAKNVDDAEHQTMDQPCERVDNEGMITTCDAADIEPPVKSRKMDPTSHADRSNTLDFKVEATPGDVRQGLESEHCTLSKDDVQTSPTALPQFEADKCSMDLACTLCQRVSIDPKKKDLVMFLHAHKYKGPDWQYEAALPEWAAHDWNREDEFLA